MDNRTKAVTIMLRNVGYKKATEILESCMLPKDEFNIVHEHIIYKKPLGYVADTYNISYSTAKRKLKTALLNIYKTLSQL